MITIMNMLYAICPECYWEYDVLQTVEPDYAGGANCHSLNEYRTIYWNLKNSNSDFSCRNEDDRKLMVELEHQK